MRSWVDGKSVEAEVLVARELGFGRALDGGQGLSCRLELDPAEMDAVFGPLYNSYVAETKGEIAEGMDPDPEALAEAGFPDVVSLRSSHWQVFVELLTEYLEMDFCHALVKGNLNRERWRYVINALRTVRNENGCIVLGVEVYPLAGSVPPR